MCGACTSEFLIGISDVVRRLYFYMFICCIHKCVHKSPEIVFCFRRRLLARLLAPRARRAQPVRCRVPLRRHASFYIYMCLIYIYIYVYIGLHVACCKMLPNKSHHKRYIKLVSRHSKPCRLLGIAEGETVWFNSHGKLCDLWLVELLLSTRKFSYKKL